MAAAATTTTTKIIIMIISGVVITHPRVGSGAQRTGVVNMLLKL